MEECSFQVFVKKNVFTDLRRVDIDQCPQKQVPGITQPLNIFAGTDKCKQRTTEVRLFSSS